MRRLLAYVLVTACSALLGFPTGSAAKNNLGLIPDNGIRFGIVKRSSTKITVTLERSGKAFDGDLNDSQLIINDVPAGTVDARPVYNNTDDGIPFATAFPSGAYELVDSGWGDGRDLLAARGCVQQKAVVGRSWDSARVYCDKVGIEQITIAGSAGNDAIFVDPAVTAPVRFKCHGAQEACGQSCLLPADFTCCDPTPAGFTACWVRVGDTCSADSAYCEGTPFHP